MLCCLKDKSGCDELRDTTGKTESPRTFLLVGRALGIFLSKVAFILVGFGFNEANVESLGKLTARSWAGSGRFRGNEARSDHDWVVRLPI